MKGSFACFYNDGSKMLMAYAVASGGQHLGE
jgi:hypothetical protein